MTLRSGGELDRVWTHPDISLIRETCSVCPEQYEGILCDGRMFYLRMRSNRAQLGIAPAGETFWTAVREAPRATIDFGRDDPHRGMFDDDAEANETFATLLHSWERGDVA